MTSVTNPHGPHVPYTPKPSHRPADQPVSFGPQQEKGTMFRLLVTGGRDLDDAEVVWNPLFWVLHKYELITVVHGDCPTGADRFAREWCEMLDSATEAAKAERNADRMALQEAYPADWNKHGKAAGPIRNQEMVTLGANCVFAFPTPASRGTLDCMARAWVKGIPVYQFRHDQVGRFRQMTEAEGEILARRMLHWGS